MKNIRNFRGLIWVPVMALAFLAACDNILDVVDPDTVNPATLEDPDVIDVVIAGAIGDFAVAYSGAGLADAFLSSTAAMSDEFFSTGTFSTRTATDRRIQRTPANGNMSDGAYNNLQQARRALMNAAVKIAAHPDKGTGDPEFAELQALWGFTYVALGEAYCSSVPISNDEEPDPSDGPPRTSMELFQEAVPIFVAAGSTNLANMGKARALMDMGDYAGAAALVGGVPTDWTYFIEHSALDGREYNPLFSLQSNGRYSVSQFEGGNLTGLPFRGAGAGTDPALADPRIPWFEDPLGGFDPAFNLYTQLKYPTRNSEVVLASGVEARLIEAEAALAVGGGWLAILNALRADVLNLMGAQVEDYSDAVSVITDPTLADLVDPGTARPGRHALSGAGHVAVWHRAPAR
ncbi:MAG: hypothetical protein IIB90_12385 [Gemmatimonadetes bacterium]|nr:hypothetical protein [Gemmatimonadota bacterium]